MKTSHISNKEIKRGEEIKGHDIREGIFNLIKSNFPDFDIESYITIDGLYLTSLITQEKGEIAEIDRDVMQAINNNSILSENIQASGERQENTYC